MKLIGRVEMSSVVEGYRHSGTANLACATGQTAEGGSDAGRF
jgi:hypothetical protein